MGAVVFNIDKPEEVTAKVDQDGTDQAGAVQAIPDEIKPNNIPNFVTSPSDWHILATTTGIEATLGTYYYSGSIKEFSKAISK